MEKLDKFLIPKEYRKEVSAWLHSQTISHAHIYEDEHIVKTEVYNPLFNNSLMEMNNRNNNKIQSEYLNYLGHEPIRCTMGDHYWILIRAINDNNILVEKEVCKYCGEQKE